MSKIKYILLLLIAAMVVVTTSCSETGSGDEPLVPGVDSAGVYINLNIRFSINSRATAHETEDAKKLESAVKDLTLFFYKGDIRSAADTPFLHRQYFDSSDISEIQNQISNGTTTVDQDLKLNDDFQPEVGDRVALVLNMGDLTSIETLGELRDYQHTQALWEAVGDDVTTSTNFAMSSSDGITDGQIKPVGGTDRRYSVELKVERLAARIDFGFDSGVETLTDGLKYSVKDSAGTKEVATLKITHVLPVNVMKQPTYCIKHVTNDLPEEFENLINSVTYNLKEWPSDTERPSGYVLDPNSHLKDGTYDVPDEWFDQPATTVTEDTFTKENALSLTKELIDQKYITLTYANENTVHKSQHNSKYLTGLVIKGIYTPKQIIDKDGNPASPKSDGTFWRCRVLNQSMQEEKNLYFNSEEEAKAYIKGHTTLSISAPIEYPGGECYYRVWIRHAVEDVVNDKPRDTFAMEYGIVRNHIYRIGVSISGPGSPEIDIREPENVKPIIYVRKWNLRTLQEILM